MAVSISSPAKDRGQQRPINLVHKIGLIQDHWQPRVVAEMNDYQFKVVKIAGDFIWHAHGDTDEVFIVLEGMLRIDFRDHSIELQAGEMAVVSRGVEHKTFAAMEAKLLMIEPMGVPNTGDSDSERRAPNDVWI